VATNSFVSIPEYLPGTPTVRNLRAVVVDDTPEILHLMVKLLELAGQIDVVAIARDGVEAVSAVRAYDPDLIVMDVNMPRMNGLSAALKIRELDSPAKILIMSSDDNPETRVAALDAGADDFLPKTNMMRHCRAYLHRLFPERYQALQ